MIVGIGTDLVETQRIADSLARHGERFAHRILAACERGEFQDAANRARFLAKRFAAKEAFAKAAGTGIRTPVTLHSVWVAHDALGKPSAQVTPALAEWLAARGVAAWHLSLTDERAYAMAVVVLEGASASATQASRDE